MTSPLPPPPPVAAQVTEKVVVVVPPAGTVTVRGFEPPSRGAVYRRGSGLDRVGLALPGRLPVCGGGAVQVTENDVEAVAPAVTLAVRDAPPLTLQFPATPDRTTV